MFVKIFYLRLSMYNEKVRGKFHINKNKTFKPLRKYKNGFLRITFDELDLMGNNFS